MNEIKNNNFLRYDRQINVKQFGGIKSQKNLFKKKVLIVGAGGLGSLLCLYLCGAGIGTLGIIDNDYVEISNLHRQIIHNTNDANIKLNKAISASNKCKLLNSECNINTYPIYFQANSSCINILKEYDIIVDATDNLETRYLLNDLSILYKKPFISGSALSLEGQVTVYDHYLDISCKNKGPCYRCIYPKKLASKYQKNCSTGGIIGPIVGIISSVQSMEILKIAAENDHELLIGKIWHYDGYNSQVRIIDISQQRNKDCQICGNNPIININNILNLNSNYYQNNICQQQLPYINIDTFYQLKKKNEDQMMIIDVRSQQAYNLDHIIDSICIPMNNILNDTSNLLKKILKNNKEKIYFICQKGNSSKKVLAYIIDKYQANNVINVNGGLNAYRSYELNQK